jgi:hypothetical protein
MADVFTTRFFQDPPVGLLVFTSRQMTVAVREVLDHAPASPGGVGKMSPTTVVRQPAAVHWRLATKVMVPVVPTPETSPGTTDAAVTRQVSRYVPSSPIAVAGSSGGVVGVAVRGPVAVPAREVAVALRPVLDLVGVVVLVAETVRPADRLGGGTGAMRGATLAGAEVTAAEAVADPDVPPARTDVDAATAGATGGPSAVVEPAREIRKIVPATATTTATTPPTAAAGATPTREPVDVERKTRRGIDRAAVDG